MGSFAHGSPVNGGSDGEATCDVQFEARALTSGE